MSNSTGRPWNKESARRNGVIIRLTGVSLNNDKLACVHDCLLRIQASDGRLKGGAYDVSIPTSVQTQPQEVLPLAFELEGIIENVLSAAAKAVEPRGLGLVCSMKHDVPLLLLGDPSRIGRILVTYVHYLAASTAGDQIALDVRVQHRTDLQATLLFEVSDAGMGSAGRAVSDLMLAMVQRRARTAMGRGTANVAMAACERLAQLMGAAVGQETDADGCVTLWLSVPLGIASRTGKFLTSAASGLQGKRVLVIDHDEYAARLLCEMLTELGVYAEHTNVSQAALKKIVAAQDGYRPFDFVASDAVMVSDAEQNCAHGDGDWLVNQDRAVARPKSMA